MWNRPWTMKEGFAIGAGLIALGLVLQLSVGPVCWDALRWPVNGLVLAVFLTVIALIHLLRKRVHGFQFIGTYKAAVPALAYVVVLTIIMGLTPQTSTTPEGEGSLWLNHMLSFWSFVLVYAYLDVILGLVVIRRIFNFQFSICNLKRDIPFLLNHLGLFLALTAASLGNADMQRVKMVTVVGLPEWRAMTEEGIIQEMPMAIELERFIMETYDDGKPRRFASNIIISHPSDALNSYHTVEVNKPVEADGWMIYQYGYDTQKGAMSQMSILELIRDPWLPLVYAGIYMLLAGAVCHMLRAIPWVGGWRRARQHPKVALSILVLTLAAFFCVHHFMPILHSDTLVPALQSPWFKPHIIAYMLAYTLMASAAVITLFQIFRRANSQSLIANGYQPAIIIIGLSLMTFGMLFGALWAKEAWGHYWSWDPKETWAAITWFSYLIYLHYRQIPSHRPKLALCLVLVSFVLLQMCWWGIKFLPSALAASVHVYSQ